MDRGAVCARVAGTLPVAQRPAEGGVVDAGHERRARVLDRQLDQCRHHATAAADRGGTIGVRTILSGIKCTLLAKRGPARQQINAASGTVMLQCVGQAAGR